MNQLAINTGNYLESEVIDTETLLFFAVFHGASGDDSMGLLSNAPTYTRFEPTPMACSTSERVVTLVSIGNYELSVPLDVIVENDGDSYIARSASFPLYGWGEDTIEALEMFEREWVSFYEDLQEDDNLPDNLLRTRRLFDRYLG